MKFKIALVSIASALSIGVQAADWSDTSMGIAHGNKFAEPYEGNNISKNIINLTHVSGYKYGTNFFNVDMLMSNEKNAAFASQSGGSSRTGAQEVYVVYRNTVDLSKVTGKDYKSTGIRGWGVTGGFDYNTKADNGYNSKKQMLVAGPTVMLDVPGFLNVSLLELWESNSPFGYNSFATGNGNSGYAGIERYHYKMHPALSASWGIPFTAGVPLDFEGVANFISAKGKDEAGKETVAETYIDLRLMYDLSPSLGIAPKTFKVGAAYQYWKNKFGNNASGDAGSGAFAKTPMLRAEYHF